MTNQNVFNVIEIGHTSDSAQLLFVETNLKQRVPIGWQYPALFPTSLPVNILDTDVTAAHRYTVNNYSFLNAVFYFSQKHTLIRPLKENTIQNIFQTETSVAPKKKYLLKRALLYLPNQMVDVH